MADFLGRYGQWALVAGAAEGIGAAYCEELAKKGMNVILVDLNEKGMESLSKELETRYKINTTSLVCDLSEHNAPDLCMKVIRDSGCRLMIYNAAYSRVKPFLANNYSEMDLYINVNARTPLKLVRLFSEELRKNNLKGGILLMSSLAGMYGTSLVSVYSGTKGFNLMLAEALSYELKPYGVEVSACCAGATATPGYLGSNPSSGFISPPVMKPSKVAAIALRKLGKKTVIIPGLANKLSYFMLVRLLPRSISAILVNKTMNKTYSHH